MAFAFRCELEQAFCLPFEHRVGHALERLAEHDEPSGGGVTRAEMEVAQPAAAPSVAPFGREHHQVERVRASPSTRRLLACRLVQRPSAFTMTPSWPCASASSRKRSAAAESSVSILGTRRCSGTRARGARTALAGAVEEVVSVEMEAVEQRDGERDRFGGAAPSPPEPNRLIVAWNAVTAVGPHGDHLAVEDRGLERQPPDRLDDLGHALGDVREAARIGAPRRRAGAPGAVRRRASIRRRRAGAADRVGDGLGRLREHRLDGRRSWSPKLERPLRPSASAATATGGSSPASMSARRTSPAGTPAARATASTMTPSSAPCRSSPCRTSIRKRCSTSVALANSWVSSVLRRPASRGRRWQQCVEGPRPRRAARVSAAAPRDQEAPGGEAQPTPIRFSVPER